MLDYTNNTAVGFDFAVVVALIKENVVSSPQKKIIKNWNLTYIKWI